MTNIFDYPFCFSSLSETRYFIPVALVLVLVAFFLIYRFRSLLCRLCSAVFKILWNGIRYAQETLFSLFEMKEWQLLVGTIAGGSARGSIMSLTIGAVLVFAMYGLINFYIFKPNLEPYFKFEFKDKYIASEYRAYSDENLDRIQICKHEDKGVLVKRGMNSAAKICFKKDADALKVQLFIYDESNNPQEIEWWKENNIAADNCVFRIKTYWWVSRFPDYPTSTSALVSWLKKYGNQKPCYGNNGIEIKVSTHNLNKKEWDSVAGQLDILFENGCSFNDRSDVFLLLVRAVNFQKIPIQFLCFAFAFSIGITCRCRWRLFQDTTVERINFNVNRSNPGRYIPVKEFPSYSELKADSEVFSDWLEFELDVSLECGKSFREQWGCDSPQWFVWRNGLLLFRNAAISKYSSLVEIGDVAKTSMNNSRYYTQWMLDSIPALGFIGTVIGIGQTMVGTGSILSDELGKQQSRISEVAISLAFAFDTTLIALALSLIVGAWLTHRIKDEEERVTWIQELLIGKVQSIES